MTTVKELLSQHQTGKSLPPALYRDPNIFGEELERILLKSWLYVGHSSQVPEVGDYFLFEFVNESVIVVRSSMQEIRALVNVCRHRGSRVCLDLQGRTKRFTCPYHGWSYGLDGQLMAAAFMNPNIDKGELGLRAIHLEVLHGMIFVSFAEQPADFDVIRNDLDSSLAPYDLANAKVAHAQNYPIEANWKLAVENYCECYHCAPAHPEYSVAHGRAVPDCNTTDAYARVLARAADVGLTTEMVDVDWLDAGQLGLERSFERYPLFKGHVTGSKNGRPVAPLLGNIRGYDGGCTDIHIGPLTFFLAYCDHVVVYRFTPRVVDKTDCEIVWLVHADAKEGKDYQLNELIWLWNVTTITDKAIIERNQAGVNSRFYQPGPLSTMETYMAQFDAWYLHHMGA